VALPHAIEAYKQVRTLVKEECAHWSGAVITDDQDKMEVDEDNVYSNNDNNDDDEATSTTATKTVKDSQLIPFQVAPLSTDKRDMKQVMTTFLSSLSSNQTGIFS